jgi:hypothetical protein
MSDLKNTEATVEHFEAYSAAYLALICNAAIINGVQKANCFSFYGSKIQQLRWYEVSLKVKFLEAFLSRMEGSETYL